MSMAGEEIVEVWLNHKGYFVMRNVRVKGGREIDFLAFAPKGGCEELGERCHVEVQASPYARVIGKPFYPPEEWAEKLVARKFNHKDVMAEAEKWFGKDYEKILVLGSYGRIEPDKEERERLIRKVEELGVRVVKFEKVLTEVLDSLGTGTYTQPSLRILQFLKFMEKW